jgi:hypothetical protein
MVRGRIKSKTKKKYQKAIRDVVKGLSRKVLVYKQPLKSVCPNCYYDKMTNSSTGKCSWTALEAIAKQQEWEAAGNINIRYKYFLKGRCPVCHGLGYIETHRRVWTDCLVIWDPGARGFGNDMTYTPAGTEGSTIVKLKTDPKNYDVFKNCSKIVIDGVECKLSKPPILRGLGNQALLIITAFTTEKPQIDSGEIIKDYT